MITIIITMMMMTIIMIIIIIITIIEKIVLQWGCVELYKITGQLNMNKKGPSKSLHVGEDTQKKWSCKNYE